MPTQLPSQIGDLTLDYGQCQSVDARKFLIARCEDSLAVGISSGLLAVNAAKGTTSMNVDARLELRLEDARELHRLLGQAIREQLAPSSRVAAKRSTEPAVLEQRIAATARLASLGD